MTIYYKQWYCVFLLGFCGIFNHVQAKVYYSKQEAMELAFGKKATIEMLSLFPDQQKLHAIEQRARVKVKSSLYTFYVGKKMIKFLAMQHWNRIRSEQNRKP